MKEGETLFKKMRHSALFTKSKPVILDVAMAAALGAGAWLLISPALKRQSNLKKQEELIQSIAADSAYVRNTLPASHSSEKMADESVVDDLSELPIVNTLPPIEGVGLLYIDSIDSVLPVTNTATAADLDIAVGHVPETAPIGSEGNAVIAGHRSYAYGEYFNRLGELTVGDLIRYEDKSGISFTYSVYEMLVIEPEDPAVFEHAAGERILTLFTCTPIDTATHRLLVRARLINTSYLGEDIE